MPLIIVRGEDMKVRSFYNICPHRGNTILYDPAGNAKRMTCIFHAWSFDTKGSCIDISRGREGYQERFSKEDAGMRQVKSAVGFGGFSVPEPRAKRPALSCGGGAMGIRPAP